MRELHNKNRKIHERGRDFFYYRGEKALQIKEGENESKLKTEAKLLMH